MLKKIRMKFIRLAMLAFAIVILSIAAGINVVNYLENTRRLDESLEHILAFERSYGVAEEGQRAEMIPWDMVPNDYDPEANYTTRYFAVAFDENGEASFIHTAYIFAVDEENAAVYAGKALERSSDRGFIDTYRYIRYTEDGESIVVFLNAALDLQMMKSLALLTIMIACGSLVVVFVLVFFLSGFAIKPYLKNVERQKQFITDASHELKTPVTSIAASADVLELEVGESEWIRNIQKQTGDLSELIQKLVILSRLDEEQPHPAKENFSISETAWEIFEVFEGSARAKEKRLVQQIEDGLTYAGDPQLIGQMFSVLTENAVKYAPRGKTIEICLHRKRGRIVFETKNPYEGIPMGDVNRLFERFYRPDASRSSGTGGHGIGLSVAKSIANVHGGKISAHTAENGTITFRVVL